MGAARKESSSSAAGPGGPSHSRLVRLAEVARAGEWWEYKLVPILAIFYAAALHAGAPLTELWFAALSLLAAIVPGAIYVSLVNDWTDRAEDAAAGKKNRLAGRSTAAALALMALPVAAGLAFAFAWRDDPLLFVPYLCAWAAFSLYSIPPIRLKGRGLSGVLADASGAHLFPTLVGAILVFRAAGAEPSLPFLAAAGLWAVAYGLRGILWHQLLDAEHDRAASVRTFVQRHPRARVVRLVHFLLFPIELAAFSLLLGQLPTLLPVLFLFAYAWLVLRRIRTFALRAVIVEPRRRYLIILHEYYDLFLPLALLLAAAWRHPPDATALLLHFLLFPRRLLTTASDAWRLPLLGPVGRPRPR
jgi:1,4-dihydroxy-2-naphthoate octaprenyltransferase